MANDGIRIDINQLDFNNGKEISKDDYEYNAMNRGSKYSIWKGDESRILYDGINADEANYIITEFQKAGYLDGDGVLDMDEINEFLTTRYNEHFGEGKWETTGVAEKAAKQLYDLVNKIVTTYAKENEQPAEEPSKPAIDTSKPGLTQQDDGNYAVEVQNWGAAPLEGNNSANDCLYRIMKNYYPEVQSGSDEWKALEKQIMDLNSNIYGTVDDSGNWTPARNVLVEGSRQNSVIYTGESIMLPANTQGSEPADDGEEAIDSDAILSSLTDQQKIDLVESGSAEIDGATLTYDKDSNKLTIKMGEQTQTVTITPEELGYKPQATPRSGDDGYDMDKVVNNIKTNFTPEQIKSLADGNWVTYDEDSDLNIHYKDGVLHISDAQTNKELGSIQISLEDLGYVTEEQGSNTLLTGLTQEQFDEYQQYAQLLAGNDNWNTDYINGLMTALSTGNQVGQYVASSTEQKEQYLSEVRTYFNNLQKFSGSINTEPTKTEYSNIITMANMMGHDLVQMYLEKINDPDKDFATANKEMENYWTNVSKLGKEYQNAKDTYESMRNRTRSNEYLSGYFNTDFTYTHPQFDSSYIYQNAMQGYDGSETDQYGHDNATKFTNAINGYNNLAEGYNYYNYDTESKINSLSVENDVKAKLKDLVRYYDAFMQEGGVYNSVTGFLSGSPYKDSAKNLAANAEALMKYYLEGVIPKTIPDLNEVLSLFENTVPTWQVK